MKLGIHNSPPYMHNGACETLLCVASAIDVRPPGRGYR
jgi:hypothetical protein